MQTDVGRVMEWAQKGGVIVYLWWVDCKGHEWGSYVIECTRGKAKARFYRYYSYFEYMGYTDIRCVKIKPADGYDPALLDEDDDPKLKELGVKYADVEE